MKTVHLKHIELGAGVPKIAVPLVAKDSDGLLQAVAAVRQVGADIVEFRADFLENAGNVDFVLAQTALVREALPDTPLLFTFRRSAEGGSFPCSDSDYFALLQRVAVSGLIDMLDIELFAGKAGVQQTIAAAKAVGVAVLLCNHDFQATPPQPEITGRLKSMAELGADVCKIAVMPQSADDVLTLLAATAEARKAIDCPIVTMSMGKLGAISRLAGQTFGSAMTFGTAGQESAPGQIPADKLREILAALSLG
ncbi:type I 3-dehydroquinate dehydratase [Neisseria sp. ZJ106]|uniref:3-dehydroquinate dehydratase n=1 Tax=Neisseria lisongii TaxID=2912188 RepID=A0ABY7RKD3_9NEIS|nr:type I 3-dehydroquinate dehydratase [Neisseria lisongii]MCF7520777.1 type I 3-dehydroquinate dehydratase [Neisseria lisongii]WCL70715.1 type I 3-dehydroquinate dehydratase [Neisseria lisongii]